MFEKKNSKRIRNKLKREDFAAGIHKFFSIKFISKLGNFSIKNLLKVSNRHVSDFKAKDLQNIKK